jgi:hypothetical protein
MATAPNELDDLRSRVAALEDELAERTERANAAVAAAQDRSYWLDRWRVDLNAVMRKRGATAAFNAARSMYRFARDARARARDLPRKARVARQELDRERVAAQPQLAERFHRHAPPDRLTASPVTDLLHARLQEPDVEEVFARLEPADAALLEAADPAERRRLVLTFAAHYGVEPALSRSGLTAETPPPEVHAMARGALAAGGSTYYADLVADALAAGGLALAYLLYVRRPDLPPVLAERLGGLYALVRDKFRVDELYDAVVVRPVFSAAELSARRIDPGVIDGAVNGAGLLVAATSGLWRRLQTGNVQHYALSFLLGALVLLGYYVAR